MAVRIVFRDDHQNDRYDLFDVYFHNYDKIQTMVTADPDVVTQWITETTGPGRLIVGLDVEWRPSFNRNQQNPVSILQLCVGHRCLIFQLLRTSIPASLVSFLSNGEHTFVGVGVKNDVEKFEEDHEVSVAGGNVVDLRGLAADAYGMMNLRNAGLKELCNVVLGLQFVKPKRITMGRWDNEWLNTDQVQYACLDAFVSYEIGRRLLNAGASS